MVVLRQSLRQFDFSVVHKGNVFCRSEFLSI